MAVNSYLKIKRKRNGYVKSYKLFNSFLQIFLDIHKPITYNEFNRYDHATDLCRKSLFSRRGSSALAFLRSERKELTGGSTLLDC